MNEREPLKRPISGTVGYFDKKTEKDLKNPLRSLEKIVSKSPPEKRKELREDIANGLRYVLPQLSWAEGLVPYEELMEGRPEDQRERLYKWFKSDEAGRVANLEREIEETDRQFFAESELYAIISWSSFLSILANFPSSFPPIAPGLITSGFLAAALDCRRRKEPKRDKLFLGMKDKKQEGGGVISYLLGQSFLREELEREKKGRAWKPQTDFNTPF